MARREYNVKMNLNLSGQSFVDETKINVGSSAFYIDHDFFFDDDASGDVLVIRTAAAGGGTLLTRDTDYTITNQDTYLTTETGKNCYSTVTIINVAYQATTLYFSGKYVADAVDKEDVGRVTWQYSAVNASATLAPTGYTSYGCTAGTNGIRLVLPAVSMAYTNIKLEFIKLDDTNSAITIDGSGAETINGLAQIFLIEKYQKIELICTGTEWIITKGSLIADTGWIDNSDWTTINLGCGNCTYDGKVGTFQVGEIIKEATSSNTGIIVADSGTVLTLWRVTGTGIWTNDRVITGQISGATANVNNASTTKNASTNFYHGWAVPSYMLTAFGYYSTARSEATSYQTYPSAGIDGVSYSGVLMNGVDTNNVKFECSGAGPLIITGGQTYNLGANDEHYRFVVKLII